MKQQETQGKTSNRNRWIILILVVLALAASFYPAYHQQQLTASQRLFAEGVKLESLGQPASAEKIYQEIYQRYPQTQEAAASLFRIAKFWQLNRQDVQRALLYYLKVEHDYPENPLVLPACEEAARIVKYALRDFSRAIEFYQRLLDLNTGTPDQYYYEIADCYFRLENYPQARIELETLLEKYPQSTLSADVLYRKAGILLLEGRAEEARQDWLDVIDQYPDSKYRIQAEFDLAKVLEEDGFLTEALQHYQQLKGDVEPALLDEKIKHLQKRIKDKREAI